MVTDYYNKQYAGHYLMFFFYRHRWLQGSLRENHKEANAQVIISATTDNTAKNHVSKRTRTKVFFLKRCTLQKTHKNK